MGERKGKGVGRGFTVYTFAITHTEQPRSCSPAGPSLVGSLVSKTAISAVCVCGCVLYGVCVCVCVCGWGKETGKGLEQVSLVKYFQC